MQAVRHDRRDGSAHCRRCSHGPVDARLIDPRFNLSGGLTRASNARGKVAHRDTPGVELRRSCLMSDFPKEAEALLSVAPDDFVTERNRLTRELRDAGRKDEAAAVTTLRKPPPSFSRPMEQRVAARRWPRTLPASQSK